MKRVVAKTKSKHTRKKAGRRHTGNIHNNVTKTKTTCFLILKKRQVYEDQVKTSQGGASNHSGEEKTKTETVK